MESLQIGKIKVEDRMKKAADLKRAIFRGGILCLFACLIAVLSGCGETAEGAVKSLKESMGEKTKQMTQEGIESGKGDYLPISNSRIMELYAPIWKEYEYAQYYQAYHEEVWEEIGINPAEGIWLASRYSDDSLYYYSFMDINQDGIVELLIGVDYTFHWKDEGAKENKENIELHTYYYYYLPDRKVSEGYVRYRIGINLYEGGILEYVYDSGSTENYAYYALTDGEWKRLDNLRSEWEWSLPEDAPENTERVYRRERIESGEWEYINEEEYYAIRQEYTTIPMKIEWKPFDGFETGE